MLQNSVGGSANGDGIAFMIQSLLTLRSSMTYYNVLSAYDTQKPVQASYFVQATVPVSATAITVVTTALGVHYCLFTSFGAMSGPDEALKIGRDPGCYGEYAANTWPFSIWK